VDTDVTKLASDWTVPPEFSRKKKNVSSGVTTVQISRKPLITNQLQQIWLNYYHFREKVERVSLRRVAPQQITWLSASANARLTLARVQNYRNLSPILARHSVARPMPP